MSLRKLFLALGLLLLIGVWEACVDVPNGPVANPNPDYRSLVRFVNAVPGNAGGNVSVDGTNAGTIAYQANTAYVDLPSGSRSMSFAGGTAQTVVLGSEQQSTVVVYSNAGVTKFLNLLEGHKDKNNGDPLKAKIKFVNVAEGSAANLIVTKDSVGGLVTVPGSVAYEAGRQYQTVDPGTITFHVISVGTFAATLKGENERPTPVVSLSSGSATVTLDTSGITSYKVDVLSDNRQGFYTAAHFHIGDANTAGPIIRAINVTGQVMSFPSTKIDTAQIVPGPHPNSASVAFGTFSMTRTALTYSIDFTMAGTDTFTSAQFRGGAAGVNGPSLKSIAAAKFVSSTQSGTWTLTSGLIDSIRNGQVYVLASSQAYPAGVIRAQLRVDTATANSYTGSWTTDSVNTYRQAFNSGNMYVNFHTVANPGGQIRGQLIPVAQYGITTLPATSFEAGKMYTIIATDKGPNLTATILNDREFGVTRPAVVPGAKKLSQARK